MSYEVKKDEMVGKHVAEFQEELSLAKKLDGLVNGPRMPYGYPTGLYHPHHAVMLPKSNPKTHHEHGTLSNDVPWAVAMDVVEANVLGIYNPHKNDKEDKDE